MKRKIIIVGTLANQNWKEANASANLDVLEALKVGTLVSQKGMVAVVTVNKLKVFGFDSHGMLRSKCWPLAKDYSSVSDLELIEELKLAEAEVILQQSFPGDIVEFKTVEEKVPA